MNISPNNFLKLAAKTAEHFGFRNQADFESNPECKNCTVTLKHEAKAEDRKLDGISGLLTGGLNAYVSRKLHALSGPIFFYDIEEVPRTGETAKPFEAVAPDQVRRRGGHPFDRLDGRVHLDHVDAWIGVVGHVRSPWGGWRVRHAS